MNAVTTIVESCCKVFICVAYSGFHLIEICGRLFRQGQNLQSGSPNWAQPRSGSKNNARFGAVFHDRDSARWTFVFFGE